MTGAVVQLKNTKTMQVRSFIAKDKGDYYFHGLSTDVDYELKAQANGKTSPSRTLAPRMTAFASPPVSAR